MPTQSGQPGVRSAPAPSLETYQDIVGSGAMDRLRAAADRIRPWKLQHVNSTAAGCGVADILTGMRPLTEALGLQVSWDTIAGTGEFSEATRAVQNALQGQTDCTTERMFDAFRETTERNRHDFDLTGDIIFIHDPQPVGLIDRRHQGSRKWVWRCHLDISTPCPRVWSFLQRYVRRYDALVFSVDAFSRPMAIPQYVVPPSIDPLAEKNRPLSSDDVAGVLEKHQLDPARPILTQVTKSGRLADSVGAIRTFRLVRRHHACQLVLANIADDDSDVAPEAADADPDIHFLELPHSSDREVNALVRGSTVVMQESLQESFGLTVTEALWKKKPVVAYAAGGIPLQIRNGHSGFLVDSPELAAMRVIRLLKDPDLREVIGERAHRHVKRNFLVTRQLADYLRVMDIAMREPSRGTVAVPHTVPVKRAVCA